MGELRTVFDAMKKEREERRQALEPGRLQYAAGLLTEAGFVVVWDCSERALYIYKHKRGNNPIARLWVYTGWWSGKGIGSGRGVHKLIEKLDRKVKEE